LFISGARAPPPARFETLGWHPSAGAALGTPPSSVDSRLGVVADSELKAEG
jgi:hypothetical protein